MKSEGENISVMAAGGGERREGEIAKKGGGHRKA